MNRAQNDEYLWDRSGPVDPEVAALESLLAPYAYTARVPRRRPTRWLIAAAAVLVVALSWVAYRSSGDERDADEGAIALAVGEPHGPRLAPGGRIDAVGGGERLWIGDVGEVRLEPGARLRVVDAARARTRLYLEAGRIEALISTEVAARFFQVETAATLCVDLGCRYVLEVDDRTGETHVEVTLGQVAFESRDRAVYVPRGAEARARPGGWLGTPRFVDAPVDLRMALDAYDASESGSQRRRDAAAKTAAIASMETDTLPLWHMLADSDPEVVRTAERALVRIAGLPEAAARQKAIQGIDPAIWRAHLDPLWWRPR